MKQVTNIMRRELGGYFATPVAYVFIVIFLILAGTFTFQLGNLYDRGQADLDAFFTWHPFLYLFLVPALTMRVWAEERRSGTIELLMTLPVTMNQAILGKFLAAWIFTAIALALTFPVWITINYLGDPDNGAIFAAYLGSLFMAGGFLAIGSAVSAITKNQVIAFVISVVLCLVFILVGIPQFSQWLEAFMPEQVVDTVVSFSFFTHFQSLSRGLIEARNIVFFGSMIAFFLFLNALVLHARREA